MMNTELAVHTDPAAMQDEYKIAAEEWINVIRAEEALASVHPTLAQVDDWEAVHFAEEDARNKAKRQSNTTRMQSGARSSVSDSAFDAPGYGLLGRCSAIERPGVPGTGVRRGGR